MRTKTHEAVNNATELINCIDEVLWSVDLANSKVLEMSNACEKVYGYTATEFMNNLNLWQQLIHPHDKAIISRNDEKLAAGEQVTNQYRIIHKDGTIRHIEAKLFPVLDNAGKLVKLHGITRDVTKEKRANHALMESELRFRQFFENAYAAIIVFDPKNGTVVDYNENALTLFGLSGAEILTKTICALSQNLQAADCSAQVKLASLVERVLSNKKQFTEWQFKSKNGHPIPCELRLSALSNNNTPLIYANIIDISERKEAENRILHQQKLFSSIIENTSDGISIIDARGHIKYQSKASERINGYTLEDLKGKTVYTLVHPDDLQGLEIFFKLAFQQPGTPFSSQFRFLHKHGHYVWVEGTLTNMLNDDTIHGFIANYRDITERKAAESEITALNNSLEQKVKERTAELRDTNRDLETFNYTVSHDLQAPLRAVCGFANILLEEYSANMDAEAVRLLEMMNKSAIRMGTLIHDLLEFAKLGKNELRKKETDMNELVSVTLSEVCPGFSATNQQITVHPMPTEQCDATLVKQVWFNLISNAVKYTGKKTQAKIEIGANRVNNEVVFYIKDNGAGFDMKYANNLFTAFKRMHPSSEFEGSGVGLATVQRIIQRHGGHIWAEAKVNEGATFYFTLAA